MTNEQLQARLEAANLRVLAASQHEMGAAYMRQASHPIYPGQALVCESKAAMVNALADRNEAKADLIEAATTN